MDCAHLLPFFSQCQISPHLFVVPPSFKIQLQYVVEIGECWEWTFNLVGIRLYSLNLCPSLWNWRMWSLSGGWTIATGTSQLLQHSSIQAFYPLKLHYVVHSCISIFLLWCFWHVFVLTLCWCFGLPLCRLLGLGSIICPEYFSKPLGAGKEVALLLGLRTVGICNERPSISL